MKIGSKKKTSRFLQGLLRSAIAFFHSSAWINRTAGLFRLLEKYVISGMDKPSYSKIIVVNLANLTSNGEVIVKNGNRNSHVYVVEGPYRIPNKSDSSVPGAV